MCDAALIKTIESLLAARGLAADAVQIHAGSGGGNNRVYIVDGAAIPLIAKQYFRSARDQRDRLHAEWSFVTYAHGNGIDCVPRPIAVDTGARLALYERIDGRKISAPEIGERDVLAAAAFFCALNDPARLAQADSLPRASEAGFSITEHFSLIDRRVGQLVSAVEQDGGRGIASSLISELNNYWQGLKTSVSRQARKLPLTLDETLPAELRCLSPSDFGFHNTLQRSDCSLCFIDFEYAGWDDPAKMVADFFLQPEVSVDRRFFETFMRAAVNGPWAEWHWRRVALLQPIFAVKWCCIMLNPFVAERAQAGNFANPAREAAEREQMQLKKATAAFAALQEGDGAWRM